MLANDPQVTETDALADDYEGDDATLAELMRRDVQAFLSEIVEEHNTSHDATAELAAATTGQGLAQDGETDECIRILEKLMHRETYSPLSQECPRQQVHEVVEHLALRSLMSQPSS